ncbi:MAG TPA: glycosyltransferase [Arachnia sp.]|nr:glycosyltransferase [Arachnia sp.]
MTRILVLLTNAYPYGEGEPFVGTELPFLTPHFDRVVVAATQVADGLTPRPLPPDVECWSTPEPSSRRDRVLGFASGAARAVRQGATRRLWDAGPPLAALRAGAAFEARAQWCWGRLQPRVDALGLGPGDEVTVYSYWLHHTARVGELMARRLRASLPGTAVRFVSRAHGYDLYEERNPLGRLPQRRALVDACDAVYPVSTVGERYLRERHPERSDAIHVRHLGTLEPHPSPRRTREQLSVVSCAFVTPVKRLERVPAIIEEVARRGVDVAWTHIGGGPGLVALATQVADVNHLAQVTLLGNVPNDLLPHVYHDNPSTVFLSVSSSEGVPVSMMEAISGGIPIISTDVGGVRDLVVPGTSGYLVPADFTDAAVARALLDLWQLAEEEYAELCRTTRVWWEQEFRAETAYTRFVEDLRVTR